MAEESKPGSGTGDQQNSGAQPQFDPEAFKAGMLGEISKMVQGAMKANKNDIAKLLEKHQPSRTDGQGDEQQHQEPKEHDKSGNDQKPSGESSTKAAVDPEKNALMQEIRQIRASSEARIQALEKKSESAERAAEVAKRESEVRALLGKHHFASDKAADTAFVIYSNAIQRDPDTGQLVADNLPAAKYLENDLPLNHPYLLAVKDVGGAGARGGKGGLANKKYDLERSSPGFVLKPANFQKLSAAEQTEVRQLIATS